MMMMRGFPIRRRLLDSPQNTIVTQHENKPGTGLWIRRWPKKNEFTCRLHNDWGQIKQHDEGLGSPETSPCCFSSVLVVFASITSPVLFERVSTWSCDDAAARRDHSNYTVPAVGVRVWRLCVFLSLQDAHHDTEDSVGEDDSMSGCNVSPPPVPGLNVHVQQRRRSRLCLVVCAWHLAGSAVNTASAMFALTAVWQVKPTYTLTSAAGE